MMREEILDLKKKLDNFPELMTLVDRRGEHVFVIRSSDFPLQKGKITLAAKISCCYVQEKDIHVIVDKTYLLKNMYISSIGTNSVKCIEKGELLSQAYFNLDEDFVKYIKWALSSVTKKPWIKKRGT